MHHLYHLVDPRDHSIRYVGKSRRPTARLRQHIRESHERQNTDKKRWIYQLAQEGFEPVLVIVASYRTEEIAREKESEQAQLHRETIYNIHDPAKGARALHKQREAES